MSVGVNPPKTPVTKGSNGIAMATLPNICKMPGPPAPFVPAPLPNIGKSGEKPEGYTQNVKVEGKAVAIKGASFCSMGDMASKGTGGGMISANTHGPCKFIGPGSMDVKFEGGNVHLLSDPMTNNGGGSGSPANSATMMGLAQKTEEQKTMETLCLHCGKDINGPGHEVKIESDDKLVEKAAKKGTTRKGQTVGALKNGGPVVSGGADGKLFNLKTKREIPLSEKMRDALNKEGNQLGNCVEQKLLRREYIDSSPTPQFPPTGKIKMGVTKGIMGTPTAKEAREAKPMPPCGTCNPALKAMLCTNEAAKEAF